MIQFANLPAQERELYFRQTAILLSLPPHLIEKDFWVCFVLRLLFSIESVSPHLTFKGGTSLSKVFKAIHRFSEDVDFAVSREGLGFGGKHAPDEPGLSWSVREKRLQELGHKCRDWTRDELLPTFNEKLHQSLPGLSWSIDLVEDSNQNQQVLFRYPPSAITLSTSYNPSTVRVELTARTDNHPASNAIVRSYVAEQIEDAMGDADVHVVVLNSERTFWEKATILHQLHFLENPERLPAGYSRHYYDVYQLVREGFSRSAMSDMQLLPEVADHKRVYYRQGWARYDLARNPQTLELLPNLKIETHLKRDYELMQEMIFRSPPTFDEIIQPLKSLKNEVNEKQLS